MTQSENKQILRVFVQDRVTPTWVDGVPVKLVVTCPLPYGRHEWAVLTRLDGVRSTKNRPVFPAIEVVVLPNLLALSSICLWFVLMFWLYFAVPSWFFVPFFVAATLCYLKMMETKSS